MKRTSISDLKARLSAYLDIVRRGGEVLVTDRGRPIARIAPIEGDPRTGSRRDLLVRSGQLKPPARRLPRDFWTRVRPPDPAGRSVAVLLEERGEGW
ncbi:MAG TPA: type II toxin-antitoxin system prevent-host-death family antitoxin [Gemmatimonadales bacterium]